MPNTFQLPSDETLTFGLVGCEDRVMVHVCLDSQVKVVVVLEVYFNICLHLDLDRFNLL